MPKPNEEAGNQPAENQPTPQDQPKTDAFGVEENQAPAPEVKDEGGDKGKEEKKFEPIPEDHPTIVGLNKQIEDIKREYGGNLSGQRTLIQGLEKKIEELTAGKATQAQAEEDVLFKDIKYSKDLTKEEREEMTDREIQQMDEIAAMKEAQNKMYAEQKKATKTVETSKVEDLNGSVQSIAKALATGEDGSENTDLANQIIESAKMFNLEGLTPEQLKERVTAAAKLVPDYKPVKEQPQPKGKTVNNASSDTDPFGTDQIIKEAQAKRGGDYTL